MFYKTAVFTCKAVLFSSNHTVNYSLIWPNDPLNHPSIPSRFYSINPSLKPSTHLFILSYICLPTHSHPHPSTQPFSYPPSYPNIQTPTHLFILLSICLPIHSTTYPSTLPSITSYLILTFQSSIYTTKHPSLQYLSSFLSVHLSIHPLIPHLYIYRSKYPFTHHSFSLPDSLSIHISAERLFIEQLLCIRCSSGDATLVIQPPSYSQNSRPGGAYTAVLHSFLPVTTSLPLWHLSAPLPCGRAENTSDEPDSGSLFEIARSG
jgi:hypothetical protein